MKANGNPFLLVTSCCTSCLNALEHGRLGVGQLGVGLLGVGLVGELSRWHCPLLQTLPLPQVVPSRAGCVPLALTPLEHTSSSHMFCGGRVRKG